MDKNHFIDLLQRACALPLKTDAFRTAYEQVLGGLSEGGDFQLCGLNIHSPAKVYSPHESSSTRFVISNFESLGLLQKSGELLEIGCGAGAIALYAAKMGWSVTATDIDPAAVSATLANAEKNRIQLQVFESDLFSAVTGRRYDAILFNTPFCHIWEPLSDSERPLTDFDGELYAQFMHKAKDHLKPGGFVGVTLGNCSNYFICDGWDYEVAAFDYSSATNYVRVLFKATPIQ